MNAQISQFFVCNAHDSSTKETQNFFLKKIYVDLHIELGTITYTRTIFVASIFTSTSLFLAISQNLDV